MKALTFTVITFSFSLFIGISYIFFHAAPTGRASHTDIDSKAYLAHANLFYKNSTFTWPKEGKPYYVLGYPFIIGLTYKTCGNESILPIIILQILMSLACILMLFFLLKSLNFYAGLIAMLLASCNLGLLTFSQFILTEISLTLFLLLFSLAFVRYLQTSSMKSLLSSALLLGVSVLIKPAALYFPLLIIPLIAITRYKQTEQILLSIKQSAAWLLIFLIPLNLYALHNWITFNEWYISGLGEENITHWFYPNVKAMLNGTDADFERVQLIKYSNKDIISMIKSDLYHFPHIFAATWIKNVLKTWLGLFTTNLKVLIEPNTHGGDISFFKTSGTLLERIHNYITSGTRKRWLHWIGYAESMWIILRFLLIILGCYFLVTHQQWLLLSFFLLYLAYFSGITGHDGCARFRMLFEMQLIGLSSLGIIQLIPQLRKQ